MYINLTFREKLLFIQDQEMKRIIYINSRFNCNTKRLTQKLMFYLPFQKQTEK